MTRFHRLGARTVCVWGLVAACLSSATSAAEPSPASAARSSTAAPRLEFTRMVAHWSQYSDSAYLDFIDQAQPELVQLGFYGGHFWSLAHTPQYKGYPAHFPVQGHAECGAWFEEKNQQLRRRGVKVVGHFNVEFLVGDPEGPNGPTGFFKFYRDLWDEKELGPRPTLDPMQLLEKNADGTPISQKGYGIGGMREYWGCLRNPLWRQVMKAWVRRGVERGVDGYIANYFYRHNCLCEHCQSSFRTHLKEHFSAAETKEKFGIADVDGHKFEELVAWHKPDESTPLRREMLRFSQITNKQAFDDVFVRYGRSLKPDLIVAQWNHLSNFSQISGDERCLLPGPMWGRDESYLWYSTGASAHFTDLENRNLGDGTLRARYIRGAFDDKPFTLGKYENTRIRAAIAELAANGGAPMGFYCRFTDPDARAVFAQYYQFMKRHDRLFHANRPHGEATLIFPRSDVHAGDLTALNRFRELGQRLLDDHVLVDVAPDDLATPELMGRYAAVIRPDDRPLPDFAVRPEFSRFRAPYTVRVSASRPEKRSDVTLHFVNYNREEPPKDKKGNPSGGRGASDEKPIAAEAVEVDFALPAGFEVASVSAMSPEQPDPRPVAFRVEGRRLRFTMPGFLVYGVAEIVGKQGS